MNGKVCVAYLHPNEVDAHFHHSLLQLWRWDLLHRRRIIEGGGHFGNYCGTGRLVEGRNELAAQFLDKTSAEWLWMVDADMGFDPDTVDRLVDTAHRHKRPVVSGLYFGQYLEGWGPHNTRTFSQVPMIYRWHDTTADVCGFEAIRDYPPDDVIRVTAAGAGCLLVHRDVLVTVREQFGDTWFDVVPYKGRTFGEDMSFCLKVGLADIPIWCHTGIRCSHAKIAYLTGPECMTPPGSGSPTVSR